MMRIIKFVLGTLLLFSLMACNISDNQSAPSSQTLEAENTSGTVQNTVEIQSDPDTMIEDYTAKFHASNFTEFSRYLYPDPSEDSENYELGIEIWKTIDVKSVEIKDKDLRETRGYYTIEIAFNDVGQSSFEKGSFPYYAWVEKIDGKWYVAELTAANKPDEEWMALGE